MAAGVRGVFAERPVGVSRPRLWVRGTTQRGDATGTRVCLRTQHIGLHVAAEREKGLVFGDGKTLEPGLVEMAAAPKMVLFVVSPEMRHSDPASMIPRPNPSRKAAGTDLRGEYQELLNSQAPKATTPRCTDRLLYLAVGRPSPGGAWHGNVAQEMKGDRAVHPGDEGRDHFDLLYAPQVRVESVSAFLPECDGLRYSPFCRNAFQSMPSFRIRARSVWGLIFSAAAAPRRPSIRPWVTVNAASMCCFMASSSGRI